MTPPATPRNAPDTDLLAFLKTRRWFGDKGAGHEIRDASIRDVIPIEWPNSQKPFAVARADVTTDRGTSTYQLFLERGVKLADALEDPEFRHGLADGFARSLEFSQGSARWIFEPSATGTFLAPPAARISLSKSQQSNSSVIIDNAAILKLFRKLEPGVHPDIELTRFLTVDRQFMNVPVLLGTIRFEDAGGSTVAGMLQELVPSPVDAWTHALHQTRGYFAGKPDAVSPPFIEDARRLGEITRALHDTLASGEKGTDFDMRPVGDADLATWVDKATAMLDRSMTSLQRAIASISDGDTARGVMERARNIRGRLGESIDVIGADRGSRTRVHGDYHLGQVIRSESGGRNADYLVIDFEGEPARPLSERRLHQSPLRDVAGMLRSFAYASAVGAREAGKGAQERAADWERVTREAFLEGYFTKTDGPARMLPSSRANAERLIALFETEKVFYELQYELDHRPDWAWIPMRGIAQLDT